MPYWWQSIPRQPQSRAWLRADRRAEADLAAETVTFVWEVFVGNNPIQRIQRIRSDWLGYARTCLASPPSSIQDPHVEQGWWEPHQAYLLHLSRLGQFKVGLTRVGSKRVIAVGGATATVVDRMTLANRWAALVIEHHVLDLAWDAWERPDRFAAGDKGETERLNDWLIPPPLSTVLDSLDDDTPPAGLGSQRLSESSVNDHRDADADAVEIPADVAQLLQQLYLPRAGREWLRGHNAHLGGRRPIDCVKLGDVASVIEALNVEIQGGMA